jgi:hypothetical protein
MNCENYLNVKDIDVIFSYYWFKTRAKGTPQWKDCVQTKTRVEPEIEEDAW